MRKNKVKLGLSVLTVLATPIAVNAVASSDAQAEYRGSIFYHNNKPANWWYNDGTDWFFFQNGKKFTGYGKDNAGSHNFVNGKYAEEKKVPITGYVNGVYYVNGKVANWWYDDGTDWFFFQNGKKFTGYGKDNAGAHNFVNGKYAEEKKVPTTGYVNGVYYVNGKVANWWYDDGTDWFFFQNGKKFTGYGKDNAGAHNFVNGKYAEEKKESSVPTRGYANGVYYVDGKPANWWYDDGTDWYFFQDGKKFTGYGKDSAGVYYFYNGKYQQSNLKKVLDIARSYLGVETGSKEHKKIVDVYNSVNPKPVGYTAKYDDDWCDIFVTTVFQQAGLSHLIGRECGVQRHIGIMEKKGIWKGKSLPQQGDVVTFDWDGGGWADHIGIVESVSNGVITTIEGNSSLSAGSTEKTRVNRKTYNWDSKYIKGYARPAY